MTRSSANALAVARPAIVIVMVFNALYALVIAGLLVFSLTMDGWPERALGFDLTRAHPWAPLGLRTMVVIGLIGAAVVHVVLKRVLAIVDSVRVGDPFIVENARRLEQVAWCVLALEGLRLAVAGVAAVVWEPGRIEAFSVAPWLAVLLLFVLAGVFSHGARMRADLEGTV